MQVSLRSVPVSPRKRRRGTRRWMLLGLGSSLVPTTGCQQLATFMQVAAMMLGMAAAARSPMPPMQPSPPGGPMIPGGVPPSSAVGVPGSTAPNGGIPNFDQVPKPPPMGPPGSTSPVATTGGTLNLPSSVRFLARNQWDQNPPTSRWERDRAPETITIHHSAAPASQRIEVIRDYHIQTKGWADIAYHFLIKQDGTIYEGRPVGILGAHSGKNAGRIGICLVGSFSESDFNGPDFAPMKASLVALLQALNQAYPATQGRNRPHGIEKRKDGHGSKVCPGRTVEAFGTQMALWENGYQPTYAYRPDGSPEPEELDTHDIDSH